MTATIILYKITALISLITFFYFGYDMKKRADWKNLAPQKSTYIMKLMAIVLALTLIVTVVIMGEPKTLDYIALVLFITGAVLVKKAKTELEKNNAFTWTGYVLEKPQLVTSGVYSYIRHPLYTGVYLTEIGGVFVVLGRTPHYFPQQYLWINAVLICVLFYAMFFNSILAKKESDNLLRIFGDDYKQYSQNVHAFIPKLFK